MYDVIRVISFLSILFVCGSTSGQSTDVFEVTEVFDETKPRKYKRADFSNLEDVFYEDQEYIVRRICKGEWGGTIWFKNKKTGIEYSCSATCPVSINKISDSYFVTNSLAHLSGSSELIEIRTPDSLSVFKIPEPRKKKNGKNFWYHQDLESQSRKGINEIWSDIGILIITSFVYNKQLYHVMNEGGGTFIGLIKDENITKLQFISNERLWDYRPSTIILENGHKMTFFQNKDAEGYIDIFENRIKIVRYR